jgi:hypothetical protein
MTEKATPAGWVVQVTVPAPIMPAKSEATRWLGPAVLSAPSFKYFNVAIAAANKAIEATAKHMDKAEEAEMCVVRGLSPREIAALRLAAGEVKPA